MTISASLAELLDLYEKDHGPDSILAGDPNTTLEQLPGYHDLRAEVEALVTTPENVILLAMRSMARQRESLRPAAEHAELVATFPEALSIQVRQTDKMVREMISGASEEIVVAGFAISESGGLVDLLADAAKTVQRITVLCGKWKDTDGRTAADLLAKWPKGRRKPDVHEYIDPRDKSAMHVKCLITDASRLLIGSANFTFSGMTRNFELGLYAEGDIARQARNVCQEFIGSGLFRIIE